MSEEYPTDYMQQQIPVNPNEIYASQMQEERVRNLLEQISPDNQIMDLQWRIKGYIRDPVSKQWKKIDPNAPEPHPVLIARYISYLSSILNQNTTFSNFSSSEINSIMGLIITWLTDDLDANAEEYNLKDDYTERTRIGHIMLNSVFSALKRAQNGMESRRIFSSLSMSEMNNPYGQQKKGFMEALKFWK